jgi:hypothetical protein
VARTVPDGGHAARLQPFVLAAGQALETALAAGIASPAGLSLDEVAVSTAPAVLSEAYRHPGMLPGAPEAASSADDVLRNLLTRRQIAARRGLSISTLMSWIDRYPDFPGPAPGPRRTRPTATGRTFSLTWIPGSCRADGRRRPPWKRKTATRRSARCSVCSRRG